MAYLAVREEDWALLDTLDALQPPEERTTPTQEVGRLFSTRDTAVQRAYLMRMENTTSWEPVDAGYGAIQLGLPGIARQLVDMAKADKRPERVRRAAAIADVVVERFSGHWPGLDASCGHPPGNQSTIPPLDQPACALVPFQPVPVSDLEALRARIAAWPSELADPSADDPQIALAPHVRQFILGTLDARLGDRAAALAAADRLDGMRTIDRWQPTIHALARTIRADVAEREGHPEQALELLGSPVLPPIELNGPMLGRDLEHWWRAEALFQTGRDREALAWYRNAFMGSGNEETWIPMIELRTAQIRERTGEREAAALHYAKFIRIWNDADPALMPLVEEARRNLGRLASESEG